MEKIFMSNIFDNKDDNQDAVDVSIDSSKNTSVNTSVGSVAKNETQGWQFTLQAPNVINNNISSVVKNNVTSSNIVNNGEQQQSNNSKNNNMQANQEILRTANIALQYTENGTNAKTLVQAAADAGDKAISANQEEYQTVARTSLNKKLEIMSLFLAPADVIEACDDAQKFGNEILNYSSQYGTLAQHDMTGQQLATKLGSYSKHNVNGSFDVAQLKANAKDIYNNSMKNSAITLIHGSGKTTISENTRTALTIKDTDGDFLISKIGEYGKKGTKLQSQIEAIRNPHTDMTTKRAVNEIRQGNIQYLDKKLDLGGFTGTKKEYDKMKTLYEAKKELDNGSMTQDDFQRIVKANKNIKLLDDAEMAEVTDFVTKQGFHSDSSTNHTINSAQARAKQRLSMAMFDDAQTSGINTVVTGTRMIKTAGRGGNALKDKGIIAVNKRKEDRFAKKIADIKKKANPDEKDLRKVKQYTEKIKTANQKRQYVQNKRAILAEIRRMPNKREAKIAKRNMLNIERRRRFLEKHGKDSRVLRVQGNINTVLNKTSNFANLASKKLGGALLQKAKTAILVFLKTKGTVVIAIAGGALLIFVLLGAGIGLITVVLNMFIDPGDSETNTIQYVNTSLKTYATEYVALCTDNATSTALNDVGKYASYGYPVIVGNITEQTTDRTTGAVCQLSNALQIISTYRYYAAYIAEDEDYDKDRFLQSMKASWDNTHTSPSEYTNGYDNGLVTANESYHEAYATDCANWIANIHGTAEDVIPEGCDNYTWVKTDRVTVTDAANADYYDQSTVGDAYTVTTSYYDAEMFPYENAWRTTYTWAALLEKMISAYQNAGANGIRITYKGTDADGNHTYRIQEYTRTYYKYVIEYTCAGHCAGHADIIIHFEVESDIRNMAAEGKAYIQYENGRNIILSEENFAELESFIGTRTDNYEEGRTMWAEFDVYFDGAENVLSSMEINNIVNNLETSYGTMTENQKKLITQALNGCGLFRYSKDCHGCPECGKGQTDCSGFMSWIIQKSINPSFTTLTTAGFVSIGQVWNGDFTTLQPGDMIVYGTGHQLVNGVWTGSGHIMMYLGPGDEGKVWVAECTKGSGVDGSVYQQRTISYITAKYTHVYRAW